ncbi:SpoIIE family protein phosphatase [Yinghuangia aomiensis]|uniref:SpoIIE family protein phosphatase n=1 Tax=Yinghuangia aomiensis TaxID=676205 RepID=UPI0031E8DD0A
MASVAALYVVGPALHEATIPLMQDELGLTRRDEAVARLVGLPVALTTLAVVGRTGDLRGRRSVLTVSLAVLAAGCAMLAAAFSAWFYILGRTVAVAGLAAVFVSCLAFLPAVYLPGRIQRVVGGGLAAMSLGFVAVVNVAPRASSVAGWRATTAALGLGVVAALLVTRRCLPETAPSRVKPLRDCGGTTVWLTAGILAAAGLRLAPLWGWSDARVQALLAAAGAVMLSARLRADLTRRRRAAARRQPAVPGIVYAAAGAAGVAVGFTQVVLTAAVPTLTTVAGGTPDDGALVLSAFGAGGAVGCLLVRYRRVTPVTGGSLGLPLAALGTVLLHTVLARGGQPVGGGCVAVVLVGCGTMLAAAPRMAQYLATIPRRHLGTHAALLPASILLGTAAAQALPHASVLEDAPIPDEARGLLWIGSSVIAVAALLLGRPVVALAVAGAAALQYVLAGTGPDQSVTAVAALATGAGVGAVVWHRREQAEHLERTRETAVALQRAVLHPIAPVLGRLRLASSYSPATVDTGIGGDFLEALQTHYGTRILIGDVRGKGLHAVRTVTDLLGCFRSQAHETPDLGELAARLDRQVARAAAAHGDDELFATALLLQFGSPAASRVGTGQDGFAPADPGDVLGINCGHLAPLAVSADHATRVHDVAMPTLLPLGFGTLGRIDADGRTSDLVRPFRIRLDTGTTLLLYTDGLSEARNSSGEFYPVTQQLTQAPQQDPEHLVRHLHDGVRNWTHHLTDDIAVIALTPTGPA